MSDAYEMTDRFDTAMDAGTKVRIKTPLGLCGRCQRAFIQVRRSKVEPYIECTYLNKPMPTDVTECSKFEQIGTVDIWTLAKLAHVIDDRNTPVDGAYR